MPVISPSAPNQQVQLFSTGSGMVIEGELRKCFSHIQMLFSHEGKENCSFVFTIAIPTVVAPTKSSQDSIINML